jgi:hypothetical protein
MICEVIQLIMMNAILLMMMSSNTLYFFRTLHWTSTSMINCFSKDLNAPILTLVKAREGKTISMLTSLSKLKINRHMKSLRKSFSIHEMIQNKKTINFKKNFKDIQTKFKRIKSIWFKNLNCIKWQPQRFLNCTTSVTLKIKDKC